ncbi:hypothetical protein S40288_11314 [Stachybotrys chartarum IBT 40288]|nr:hypothetical protein S40288_11314 [Stachybotrys chartarum IBT 40288]
MTQRNQPADASRPRHRVDHARDANRRHSKFGVLPAFTSSEPSKAEVAAVKILFPGVHNNDILVVLAASLAVACDMDDIIEALPPRVGKIALDDCIKIIQGRSPIDKSGKVQRVAQALRNHVQEPLSHGAPKHSSKLENGDCIVHIVKHISLLCQSHLEWCASAKRYRIKEASSTESPPLQFFYSGMFHGLPSFPENTIGLTALITSATGLSGHHMARVLAASPRWTKIYRLSFRAPQQGFGSTKIEHLRVNFLDKPSHIASLLGAIKHVQAILHSLPVPKEDAVDVDAVQQFHRRTAADIPEAQATHASDGLQALRLLNEPAPLPAFESDSRVTLHENFYYGQEDMLVEYCAVSDGSLNHRLGFGIYASVQAYLKQPILFPGDYRAWDREQVESTALLNAYFMGWTVLVDNTSNEDFNIHDGQCFTLGRLWPYLAQWYGVGWNPPKKNEAE